VVARVTLAAAVERFRELIVPALADQDGFEGFYLLTTDEGEGIVLTFWTDDEAAERSLESGYYAEQLRKFVTFFSAPPGREQYAVSLADAPVLIAS
jgi:heme-degrading monooxygenase HmoA